MFHFRTEWTHSRSTVPLPKKASCIGLNDRSLYSFATSIGPADLFFHLMKSASLSGVRSSILAILRHKKSEQNCLEIATMLVVWGHWNGNFVFDTVVVVGSISSCDVVGWACFGWPLRDREMPSLMAFPRIVLADASNISRGFTSHQRGLHQRSVP